MDQVRMEGMIVTSGLAWRSVSSDLLTSFRGLRDRQGNNHNYEQKMSVPTLTCRFEFYPRA